MQALHILVLVRNYREMTMDNVTFVDTIDDKGEPTISAIIDRGNNEFTSMLKSTYEEQQAAYDTLVTESAPTA